MPASSTRPGGYGDEKLKARLDEMQEIIALIRREGPGLWRRARALPAAGFPGSSGPGQIGGGGSDPDKLSGLAAKRVDAHDFVRSGTRDGEGRELCECGQPFGAEDHRFKPDVDPVRDAWFGTWDNLQVAHQLMIEAQRAMVSSFRPRPGDDDLDINDCCQSHLRIGVKVPHWKRGFCWWCDRQSRLLGPGPDGDRRMVPVDELRDYEDRRGEREQRASSA